MSVPVLAAPPPFAPPAVPAPTPRVRVRAKFFFQGEHKWFLKGITYGPFRPDAAGDFVGDPEKLRADLALMRGLGVNTLRIYHVPPRWFLDILAEHGLRALISIPWAEHVEFLNDRPVRAEVLATVRAAVGKHKGHPAILGYLVGNEIPTTMVRWLGVQRVTEFLEDLINLGRSVDPDALFSYASYPPTEFLLPQNVDFYTFNVYLHHQSEFEHYLLRLQNLADDRPLIMGEFGMDTVRHAESEHAEMLTWHVESVVRCGLAGTIIYAWTDEWFTGGMEITDWAFGLVTRERRPKLAFGALEEKWGGDDEHVTRRVKLPSYPKVSVIVCSYNGGQTLRACLESLLEIDYPNYEVVVVDDGSTDDTPAIIERFKDEPIIRPVRQRNMGLSYARNVGAHAATGDVFAYTDGDCMADPDWLYFLVGTLLSGPYAGVGGPNVSPPAANWGPGVRRRRAWRAEPRPPDGRRGRAHPGLQHGVPPLGLRHGRRLRLGVPQGGRRRGLLLAFAERRAGHRVFAVGHRVALPAVHAAGVPQTTGRLRRGGVHAAV